MLSKHVVFSDAGLSGTASAITPLSVYAQKVRWFSGSPWQIRTVLGLVWLLAHTGEADSRRLFFFPIITINVWAALTKLASLCSHSGQNVEGPMPSELVS